MTVAAAGTVDEVLALYDRWAGGNYDETLSQLDHALQTAALAVDAGAGDELVAAALLHDVGHLLDLGAHDGDRRSGVGDLHHESSGARYLSGLFGPGVTAPIALHVRAKRYRCAVEPADLAGLSEGSTRSLELQGGPADAEEIAAFERNPGFADAVALRGWDDGGKVDGLPVPPLEHYRPLLERLTNRPSARS
jgi:phosphonate degradation associated HDIG domain protein